MICKKRTKRHYRKLFLCRPYAVFFLFCTFSSLSIAEKKQSFVSSEAHLSDKKAGSILEVNRELLSNKERLRSLYEDSQLKYEQMVLENCPRELIDAFFVQRKEAILTLKAKIEALETIWKKEQLEEETEQEALWHQPETTIGQLVIDYGGVDFVYLMPPEISHLKLNVSSQLSVPKASWNEMLELIISSYGIGIRTLTPFLRQLYIMRVDQSGLFVITDDPKELQLTPNDARVCFVASPEATELHRIYTFLERFAPQEHMNIQIVGNTLIFIGLSGHVQEILKIYNFIAAEKYTQAYRLITLQKASSDEMANILHSLFEGTTKTMGQPMQGRIPDHSSSSLLDTAFGFRVLTLKYPAQSLFIMGKPEQLDKACSIIEDIESKITQIQEKEIYWYPCKHSEADELAEVLSLVYTKITEAPSAFGAKDQRTQEMMKLLRRGAHHVNEQQEINRSINSSKIGYSGDGAKKRSYAHHENFIVDNKTNSLVMVVEPIVLPKLKELLQKIDVPKKMVQIDVLLFEKRVSDNNSFGLNLLRLGDAARGKKELGALWNGSKRGKHHRSDHEGSLTKGLFQFIFSRGKHGDVPAFDLAYNFLLNQENIQINANPSVTTVNQTPAKIAVVDQISVSTGVIELENSDRTKDSFTREEYGIIINLTPTIHAKTENEDDIESEGKFITLTTDIIFDTTKASSVDRPDVTRRNIKNEVRIRDGETVILGGLRRKHSSERQASIALLGELPGIGKFFSNTSIEDSSTEMFIFITPRILPDPVEQFAEARRKTLQRRPGDLPEFLEEVKEAQEREKKKIFERSLQLLLGSAKSAFTR